MSVSSDESPVRSKIRLNISNCQYSVVTDVALELGWKTVNDEDDSECDVYWQDAALPPEVLSTLKSYQRINHFPGMYAIARKDHLAKNLKAMKQMFPDQFKFFPPTWCLPRDLNDLKSQFNAKRAKTFIVKPENNCQGRGIFLTRRLEEIPEKCVVQRYLHKPYLIDGLKFDLRLYVLVTCCDPLRVHIHKDGLVRLATEEYTPPLPSNLGDMCMHLTNYAINKNNPNFEFNTSKEDNFSGHKRSLKVFFERMREEGVDTEGLWESICDVIVKTICTVQPFLSHMYRSSQASDSTNAICFQILGFDIFLDHRLKPYLLEVNHTPSFATDTPLDYEIKFNVIRDSLKMMGLNEKNRTKFYSNHSKNVLQRATKNIKEIRKLRNEQREKFNKRRIKIEKTNKGGFTVIHPKQGNDEYEKHMVAAKDIWLSNTGYTKKAKKPEEKEPPKPKQTKPPRPRNICTRPKSPKFITRRRSFSPQSTSNIKKEEPTYRRDPSRLPALRIHTTGSFIKPKLFTFGQQ